MIDLKFDHVSKKYQVRQESEVASARHPLIGKLQNLRRRSKEFWALRDVSFEVRRGEALGIIGHNGAGKSTILKLLSNVTVPTSGQITINGRLSALIEVGSGFHPELTGRENVYLSGSILGMRRREIAEKLDSIIDFSGIGSFIDTPVKRYSSGMYVRLGFSIAAQLSPDILLLDEVLAVGDTEFQAKCMQRIKDLERAGTTIVFISHDLNAVKRLCDRVILIERGQIVASGLPSEVIEFYAPQPKVELSQPKDGLRFRNQAPNPALSFEIESVELLDRDGQLKYELCSGDYVRFRMIWRSDEFLEGGAVELGILTAEGAVPLIRYSNQPVSGTDINFYPGLNSIELEFEQFPLAAGEYLLTAGLHIPMVRWLYRNDQLGVFSVKEGNIFQGEYRLTSSYSIMTVPHRWIVPENEHEPVGALESEAFM